MSATCSYTWEDGSLAATKVSMRRAMKILAVDVESCMVPGKQVLRPLAGPSTRFPSFLERLKMKSLGDDHRGHAQGQLNEKQRQEPANPFFPGDLEDAQGGHEIALRGDEAGRGPHTPGVHAFLWPSAIGNIIALPEERSMP